MNVLIIHAHPEEKSFCNALMNEAKSYFEANGDSVKVNDLYNMDLKEYGGKNDFKALKNPDHFVYHFEQKHAYDNGLIIDPINKELDKLEWADFFIFNFPLWWFSFPAIMRNWVERVFVMGYTYSPGPAIPTKRVLEGKGAMCAITTGGTNFTYNETGKNGFIDNHLYHIHRGLFKYMGMKAYPPFIAWQPAKKTDEERKQELINYKEHLAHLEKFVPIY